MRKASNWRKAVVQIVAGLLAVPIEAVATTSTMTIKIDVDAGEAMQALDVLKRRAEEIARASEAISGSEGGSNATVATMKQVLEQLAILADRETQRAETMKAMFRCLNRAA